MFHSLSLSLIAFLFSSFSLSGWANSGNVGTSKTAEGRRSAEVRLSHDLDESDNRDGRWDTRIHYDHGLSDRHALRIVLTQVQRPEGDFKHSDLRLENRFQFFRQEEDGFDGGFRFEYIFEDGATKPDQARLRLTAMGDSDLWFWRSNLFFRHDVGRDAEDGIGSELRWQIMRQIGEAKWGLEGFQNFGNLRTTDGWDSQSHQLGLVVKGRLSEGLSYQTGYQLGISDGAPDQSFKFFVNQKF